MHLFIDRSPCAAVSTRSWTARLAAIMLAATLFGVFAACGLATVSTGSSAGAPYVLPTFTPEFATSAQQTVIQFCQALSDGNYTLAYSYVSAHYKQTVTRPSQLANQLPSRGKIVGCMEFGQGHLMQVSGNHATDAVTFSMSGGPFGNTTDPANVGLVQVGSTWQINSISQ